MGRKDEGYGMTQRLVLSDYISVLERGLRRATNPALELIKYHPSSVDVRSYHKPDDETRISLWSVC